jgi:hypothetical protein
LVSRIDFIAESKRNGAAGVEVEDGLGSALEAVLDLIRSLLESRSE